MHKRCGIVLTLLLCCLLCLAARAEDAEDPVTLRALLVGCDEFLSHENIAPSAEMNVRRMAMPNRPRPNKAAPMTRYVSKF